MGQCRQCGRLNLQRAVYCTSCGAKLAVSSSEDTSGSGRPRRPSLTGELLTNGLKALVGLVNKNEEHRARA